MTEDITDGEVRAAVQAAARSLARSEQCRASLERKLRQKRFGEDSIRRALNFLEERQYLDDRRFASAWIRARCSVKPQGSVRLAHELRARGVPKEIASDSVREYFESVDEGGLCREALRRLLSRSRDERKIIKSLADSGFSYKLIRLALRDCEKSFEFADNIDAAAEMIDR